MTLHSAEPLIVIVGAGHAGGTAAALLRQYGWQGGIVLVGEEPEPPYQRPPLSKAWLKNESTVQSLALKPPEFYSASMIDLRLRSRAAAIDRAAKVVMLDDGQRLIYDHLILATGSRLRKLVVPGLDPARTLELRTMADADRIKAELAPGKRLAVVGGGYIGLEVAASARAIGCEVTVVEREERLLARVSSPPIAHFVADYHRARGVTIELGASIVSAEHGSACSLMLTDGRAIACDAVLVGIGVQANDDLARTAGLDCRDGIVVDLDARTDDPAIHAIGDCSLRPQPIYQRSARIESVPNAIEQAKQAAAHICGRARPAPEVPWFWSDQYDLRLQMAGLADEVARLVTRSAPAATGSPPQFSVFHLTADGRVQSVEAVNATTDYMAGRVMIAKRVQVDPNKLADISNPIKSFMA